MILAEVRPSWEALHVLALHVVLGEHLYHVFAVEVLRLEGEHSADVHGQLKEASLEQQ
jgi:hypothetical protein